MVRPTGRYGVDESVSLSAQIIKIINDIQNGLISVPDWFNNNIQWVQTGHMTEQEFIDSYNYLIASGIAHPPTTPTPIIEEPTPIFESVKTYWVLKPSQQPSGTVEQYKITESNKQKLLSTGYIFSTREPVYSRGLIYGSHKIQNFLVVCILINMESFTLNN